MNGYEFAGILAGLIQLGAHIPYIVDIVARKTRPNLISWLLWTVIVTTTAAAQISVGASWSLMLLIGGDIGSITVVILSLCGYGYNVFGRTEKVALLLSISALALWYITANPIVAIIFAVLADGIAYVPTIVKVVRYPESETLLFWVALVCADILAFFSAPLFDTPTTLFAVPFAVMNGLVVGTILFHRSHLRYPHL
jgi:hypothetical protein